MSGSLSNATAYITNSTTIMDCSERDGLQKKYDDATKAYEAAFKNFKLLADTELRVKRLAAITAAQRARDDYPKAHHALEGHRAKHGC